MIDQREDIIQKNVQMKKNPIENLKKNLKEIIIGIKIHPIENTNKKDRKDKRIKIMKNDNMRNNLPKNNKSIYNNLKNNNSSNNN
jgi:hypothetical protein